MEDIDDVILVGGQTRMPKVREAVKKFFKKEPVLGVNPDEAVALGAAIQGNIVANQGMLQTVRIARSSLFFFFLVFILSFFSRLGLCVLGNDQRELVLVDVTPLNLGIELFGGDMSVIVPAQTPIPCKKSAEFTTVEDMQTTVDTHVCN